MARAAGGAWLRTATGSGHRLGGSARHGRPAPRGNSPRPATTRASEQFRRSSAAGTRGARPDPSRSRSWATSRCGTAASPSRRCSTASGRGSPRRERTRGTLRSTPGSAEHEMPRRRLLGFRTRCPSRRKARRLACPIAPCPRPPGRTHSPGSRCLRSDASVRGSWPRGEAVANAPAAAPTRRAARGSTPTRSPDGSACVRRRGTAPRGDRKR